MPFDRLAYPSVSWEFLSSAHITSFQKSPAFESDRDIIFSFEKQTFKVTRSSRQYTFLFKFLFFLFFRRQVQVFFLIFIFSSSRFETNKSTKGASKLRRDLINAEIANLRDLLPLPQSTRQRLSQLQLMALVCVYVRKANYFQQGKYILINRMCRVRSDHGHDGLCSRWKYSFDRRRKNFVLNVKENERKNVLLRWENLLILFCGVDRKFCTKLEF